MMLVSGSFTAFAMLFDFQQLLAMKKFAYNYSTLFRGDGSKYTVYLQLGEPEFRRIVAENLQKKWEGIRYWNQADKNERTEDTHLTKQSDHLENKWGKVDIHMLDNPRMHILEYKGGIIKGYSGMMELSGPSQLLQVAIDAGLGSKNSQGCGC